MTNPHRGPRGYASQSTTSELPKVPLGPAPGVKPAGDALEPLGEAIERIRVQIVHLEPDDIVVLESARPVRKREQRTLQALWNHVMPGVRAVVLEDGMTLRAVLRGAAQA